MPEGPMPAGEVEQQVSAFIAGPRPMLIGADWVHGSSDDLTTVFNPATGQELSHVYVASPDDVEQAVDAASRAFETWPAEAPAHRARLLWKLADLLERDADRLATVEVLNQGKPWELAQGLDVAGSVETLRFYAGWATKVYGTTSQISADPTAINATAFHAYSLMQPVGPVAAIVPWNVPLVMAVAKLAPALAAGCTVVLKPAAETPLTTLWLGELILEAGFPPGVVNIVTGGRAVGSRLVNHPRIRKIAFTGSTATGRLIASEAGRALKGVTLELGGKSPLLIFRDADLGQASEAAAASILLNSGQMCFATSRVLVDDTVFPEVVERVSAVVQTFKVGSGMDPEVGVGPLVSQRQRERVLGYIGAARAEGIEPVVGGNEIASSGYFVEPTVFASRQGQIHALRDEVFGPVLAVTSFGSESEALRQAHDTEYGLAASVWTKDVSRAHRMAAAMDAGTVWVNCNTILDESLPFSGWRQSGIGAEGGEFGLREYLRPKAVVIGL